MSMKSSISPCTCLALFSFFFFFLHPQLRMFVDLRERWRERERERETLMRERNTDRLPPVHTSTGNRACNLSVRWGCSSHLSHPAGAACLAVTQPCTPTGALPREAPMRMTALELVWRTNGVTVRGHSDCTKEQLSMGHFGKIGNLYLPFQRLFLSFPFFFFF